MDINNWRQDTQHNDTGQNDTQHEDTGQNDTQHNYTEHFKLTRSVIIFC